MYMCYIPNIAPLEYPLPWLNTALPANPYPGAGALGHCSSPAVSGAGALTAALLIRAIFAVCVTITVPMFSDAAPVTAAEFLV